MIFKGLKFGMLLQFAVGPVCIFIFQTASLQGFYPAVTGVLGVTLIDGLYILAALLGIASVIERKEVRSALKLSGAAILLIFGLSTVLGQFNIRFLPSLSIQNTPNATGVFIRSLLLTASNPLTIIFWAGLFSAKIAEQNMKRKDLYNFGFGALLSTFFFLTLISFAGSFTGTFFPPDLIQILNILVGLLLIYFSIRMFLKKT